MLKIKNLWVSAGGKTILKGVNLELNEGEVGVLMGPNGSGKSTLSLALMGHPRFKIDKGEARLNGSNVLSLSPSERQRKGLFLSFQNPVSLPGVNAIDFLRILRNKENFSDFYGLLGKLAKRLNLKEELLERSLNEDFSGGEKKKMELLQILVLRPKFLILDEIDTGLDVDALRLVAEEIGGYRKEERCGIILITHYQRILRYLKPQKVWVMERGEIVAEGDSRLIEAVEEKGYEGIRTK